VVESRTGCRRARGLLVAAWVSAILAEEDYLRGRLPLPGWPEGAAVLRLPTAETIPITVEDGHGLGAALFVWNYLAPHQQIATHVPHSGSPGLLRIAMQPPADQVRRFGLDASAESEQGEIREEVLRWAEQALGWMGEGSAFEAVWAFVAHRVPSIGPVDFASILVEQFSIDDLGCVWLNGEGIGSVTHPDTDSAWDNVEIAYWELAGEVEEPFIERMYRKRRASSLDGLEYHLDEIRHSLLSAADERRLGAAIQQGLEAETELHSDPKDVDRRRELGWAIRRADEAREDFATRNLRLVFDVARKYLKQIENTALDLGDLVQAAYLGLLRAVLKYDPTRGFKFSTYATWWIRQAITRHIADRGRTIRLPVHLVDRLSRIQRETWRLRQLHGRDPTSHELADAFGLEVAEVSRMVSLSTVPRSIHELVSEEMVSGVGIADPEDLSDMANALVVRRVLLEAVGSLGDRERRIIELRFGLIDGQNRTLEEVGSEFRLTRERIRQLQNAALSQLRESRALRKAAGYSMREGWSQGQGRDGSHG